MKALKLFALSCVIACKIMAEGTGKILTRIAINSAPPAIPTNPEIKLVKKTDNRIAI